MANSRYLRKRREKLMLEDPHCHWCGIEVIYYLLKKGEKFPDNFATLDHFISRYNGKREDPHFKKKTMTLACFKCNMKRCKEDTDAQPREKLWKLSRSYPIKGREL